MSALAILLVPRPGYPVPGTEGSERSVEITLGVIVVLAIVVAAVVGFFYWRWRR